MENRTIEEVVDGFCNLMIENNYRQKTVFEYKQKYFINIQKFFHSKGTNHYSGKTIDDFLDFRLSEVNAGNLTLSSYKVTERYALLIKDFAEGDPVNFNRTHKKTYCPSSNSMDLVKDIIESEFSGKIGRQCSAILRHFFCFLEAESLDFRKINNQILLDFLSYVTVTNKNSQSYVVRTLIAIANYASKEYKANITIDFSFWKVKRNRKRIIEPFSKEEIKAIIDSTSKNKICGKRDAAIIILAFTTGLRSVDISNLCFENINWRGKVLEITQKKTSISVQLPLTNYLLNLLADYILNERQKSNEPYIFLTSKCPYKKLQECWSLDSILRKYCKDSGIEMKPGKMMHSLRRSFATTLSVEDIPLTTVSQMLGHTDLDSDKPYLTYNVINTEQCAFSFDGIPLKSSVYCMEDDLC